MSTVEFLTNTAIIHFQVIGARHLSRSGRGLASPFVEVEVIGLDFDSGIKLTTKTVCEFPPPPSSPC